MTKKAKHTPGPWHWDGNPCSYDEETEAPWIVDNLISYPPVLGGTIRCFNPANARLIAAAPDLLEALKLCLCAVELAGWEGDQCAEKARAAIAKATGEQA